MTSTAQVNRRRERLRSLGLCSRCGKKPPLPELDYCDACQERTSSHYAAWRAERRKNGCLQCQGPSPTGTTLCRTCLDVLATRRREWRTQGLCSQCGGAPPESGKAWCGACRTRARRAQQERAQYALVQGLCIRCARLVALPGTTRCETCYYKAVATEIFKTRRRWRELQALFLTQEGQCALSGLPLQLGVDTEVDHIVPKARGGGNALSNLQWVYGPLNRLKGDRPVEDVWPIIKTLYEHMRARHDG